MVPVSVGLVLLPINGKNLSERHIPGICDYEAGQCRSRQRECVSTAGCAVLYRPYSYAEYGVTTNIAGAGMQWSWSGAEGNGMTATALLDW